MLFVLVVNNFLEGLKKCVMKVFFFLEFSVE